MEPKQLDIQMKKKKNESSYRPYTLHKNKLNMDHRLECEMKSY